MRTSFRESWLTDWARPRQWQGEARPVHFEATADGYLILPPSRGGVRRLQVAGFELDGHEQAQSSQGFVDEEQYAWERYSIADEHVRLEAEHDAERGVFDRNRGGVATPRYSEERAGLFTEFARLPALDDGESLSGVVSQYVSWCNRYGSPGLFAFLFATAGHRDDTWYVQERRTGVLKTEAEFYDLYMEADVGDERYREPVRVDWLSREVVLLRHTLALCAEAQGDESTAEGDAAREALGAASAFVTQGLGFGLPGHEQGVYFRRRVRHLEGLGVDVADLDDSLLWSWLWVNSGGSRLAFSRDPRTGRPTRVRLFDSFMSALYHLILEDLTAGQAIRRCADPKCRVYFRPKRRGEFHDLKCRTRVRRENDREGARLALELSDKGTSAEAIAAALQERLGERWTQDKTDAELSKALRAREARQVKAKTKGKRPKGGSQ